MTCNTSAVAVCCSSASRCSVDQPRVLHRDHRLGSEVLQQGDLLVGERTHFLAVDRDEAKHSLVLAAAAPTSIGAYAAEFDHRPDARIVGPVGLVRPHVEDLNVAFVSQEGWQGRHPASATVGSPL